MSALDKAQTEKQRFNQALARIRGNARLSDAAKRQDIAKEYRTHRQRMDTLRAEHKADREQRATELERQLFGVPDGADAVAYRDAIARAEAVTDVDQATALLNRSRRIGDDHLARATALVALERGWSDVIQSYSGAATDGSVKALQELGELRAGQQSRKERFAESMAFSHQSAPTEVASSARLGDYALDRLADAPAEAQSA